MGIEAALIGATVGGSLLAGREQRKGAQAAAGAQVAGQEAVIGEQRAARQSFERRIRPFEQLGTAVRDPLLTALGVTQPGQALPNQFAGRAGGLFGRLRGREPSFVPGFEPDIPERIDLGALPETPTAFDASDLDNPILDFLRTEGFRVRREAGAGGGRNVDRDLAEFQAGLATTVAPQLQQQRFTQQRQLRGQALAERAGLRQDALAENQQRINNLFNILGVAQNSAVGAGNAGLQTANNIGSSLANIGHAQAAGALGASQANQNLIGNLTGAAGLLIGSRTPPPPTPIVSPFQGEFVA